MTFPIEIDQIRAFETAMDVRLPEMYVAGMRRANGGSVTLDGEVWEFHPIRNAVTPELLRRTALDVAYHTRSALERINFPRDGLEIAQDGGGGVLILRIGADRNVGKEVWYLGHGDDSPVEMLDDVADMFARTR